MVGAREMVARMAPLPGWLSKLNGERMPWEVLRLL